MSNIKDIKIYSTRTCVYCNAEKQFLKAHNVPYREILVDTDEAAAHEMIQLSGQMGVPFTVITKEDDSQEHILGFDQPRLSTALGLG
jgi:glutaredoxin